MRSQSSRRAAELGLNPGLDPVRLANLLRRAHRLAVQRGSVPPLLRPVVHGSWQRATEAGVDPDSRAPKELGERQTATALRNHPLAGGIGDLSTLLESSLEAGYLAVLSDKNGLLLWADGDREVVEAAQAAGFSPGHLCSEEVLGTNAVGTAIAVQDA